jgi:CubicO group peptidase (beta-lactamase class C family)
MHFESKLDSVLDDIFARWGMPGMAVGIVEGDAIVYTRTFGVQSLDTQAPVTPGSVFGLASIGKCFVACAVMQLVEGGKIRLDAPLVEYLPYFKLDDDRYALITIRQVLSTPPACRTSTNLNTRICWTTPKWMRAPPSVSCAA